MRTQPQGGGRSRLGRHRHATWRAVLVALDLRAHDRGINCTYSSRPRPIDRQTAELTELLDAFCSRYTNENTAKQYRCFLEYLFRDAGTRDPRRVTEQDLIAWCRRPKANNSVRGRITAARSFFKWCHRQGIVEADPMEHVAGPDGPLRKVQRTYGRVQAQNPGRWLNKDEAFTTLLGACKDDGIVGLRDELVLRLGLMGLRASEIGSLTVGMIDTDTPAITFTGKGYKPGTVTPGRAFLAGYRRYLALYAAGLGRNPRPSDPLICPQIVSRWEHVRSDLQWGKAYGDARNSLWRIVTSRAQIAGLGHVAPHDLRRSAAGILHHSKSKDGGHMFDLEDIAKVLRHSDPAVTHRCYIDPMDTEVIDKAAAFLD